MHDKRDQVTGNRGQEETLPPVTCNLSPHYTLKELMTIVAAREIKDGDIVFCGTGISMLAAMAAKNINAPNSVIFLKPALSTRFLKKFRWPWRIPGSCTGHR